MEAPNSVLKYSFFVLLGLLLVAVVAGAIGKHSYEVQLAKLRNDVAGKDQTLEVQKNVYSKLALQSEDLKAMLKSEGEEVSALIHHLQKSNEDLLAANQLVLKWKKAYEGAASATQTTVPGTGPGAVARRRVDFKKGFGAYEVSGYTLTDPAESWLKLEQLRGLRLTLAITQDRSGAWHSYATSDDANTAVEIQLAAVNPYLLTPRWYEKIQFNAMLAGGQSGTNFGVLTGLGVSYQIKQFDIGPALFLTVSDRVEKYLGATFTWRPFQR